MESVCFISPNNSAEENRLWGPQALLEVTLLPLVPNSASINIISPHEYPLRGFAILFPKVQM